MEKHRREKALSVLVMFSMLLNFLPMGALAADVEAEHTHNQDGWSCVETAGSGVLPCTVEEHTHGEECYAMVTEGELVCTLNEDGGHNHGAECSDAEGNLTCVLTEGDGGHAHDADCYGPAQGGELICTLAEHMHTDTCGTNVESVWTCTPRQAEEGLGQDNVLDQENGALDGTEPLTPEAEAELAALRALMDKMPSSLDALPDLDSSNVNSAVTAYQALSDEASAGLTSAEADRMEAATVALMIYNLPTLRSYKPADDVAIQAAKSALDNLTETQAALVGTKNAEKLANLLAAIDDLAALAALAALDALAWSQVPSTLDGMKLDLNALVAEASRKDADTLVITVSGTSEITGFGVDFSMAGVQLVLTDGADLTLRNVQLNNYSKNTDCIRVEDGAQVTLRVAGDGVTLKSKSTTPAITLGAGSSLTITGEGERAKFTLSGPVTGDGTIRFDGVKMGQNVLKAFAVKTLELTGGVLGIDSTVAGEVVVSGGAELKGWDTSFKGSLTVDGGTVTAKTINGNVTISGGSAMLTGITGDAALTGGTLKVEASQGKSAVDGNLTLSGSAKAELIGGAPYSGGSGVPAVAGAATVEDGARFSAASYGDKAVGGGITGSVLVGSFAEKLDGQRALIVNGLSGQRVTMPSNAKSFAVAVAEADTYTMTDLYNENRVIVSGSGGAPANLTLPGENTNLAMEPTGETGSYFLETSSVVVTEKDGALSVTYNGSTKVLEDKILTVRQLDDAPTSNCIVVKPGVTGLTLVLDGLNVTTDLSPVNIRAGAQVTLDLVGENNLRYGWGSAGVQVSNGASVTITGSGSLNALPDGYVDGAGIGISQDYQANYNRLFNTGDLKDERDVGASLDGAAPTIIIKSGTVYAKGGSNCAGIGGGYSNMGNPRRGFDGGNIIISGGNVTAEGGDFAAGIGGSQYASGGSISIDNATVHAIGGSGGAAIGGGPGNDTSGAMVGGQSGTITIGSGAEVTAVGGSGAAAIGRGLGQMNGLMTPGTGDKVTIADGAQVTAYALGHDNVAVSDSYYYFAIDSGNTDGGTANVVNARFAKGVLDDRADDKIMLLDRGGNLETTLTLPRSYNAFASTVSGAGEWLVQNGATGKQLQRAYADEKIDATDAFLYTTAGGMTTQDLLRFATFRVTGSVPSGNGTLSVDGAGIEVAPRSDLIITVAPGSGFTLNTLQVGGSNVAGSVTDGQYVIRDIARDTVVEAAFGTGGGVTPPGPDVPPVGPTDPTGPVGPTDPDEREDRPERPTNPTNPTNPTTPTDPGVTIPETEVPQAPGRPDIGEQEIPLAPKPEEDIIIDESEVPLGNLPQTGTTKSGASYGAALTTLSAVAAVLGLAALRKREEEQ